AVRANKSDLFRRVSMLLTSNGRAAPRASRRWKVGVAACAFGAAVVLSGVGFARPADDRPAPQPAAAQPPREEVRPDPAQPRPGAQPREVVPASPDLAALRKAADDLEKKGADVTELRKQIEILEKSMGGRRVIVGGPDLPAPPQPGGLRVAPQ